MADIHCSKSFWTLLVSLEADFVNGLHWFLCDYLIHNYDKKVGVSGQPVRSIQKTPSKAGKVTYCAHGLSPWSMLTCIADMPMFNQILSIARVTVRSDAIQVPLQWLWGVAFGFSLLFQHPGAHFIRLCFVSSWIQSLHWLKLCWLMQNTGMRILNAIF